MAPLRSLLRRLHRTTTAQQRSLALLHRAELTQARRDSRSWMQARRARTRHLIELGGLVAKSQLDQLIALREQDLHAALLGALLELADQLEQNTAPAQVARWRERGRATFRAAPLDE